MKKMTKTEIPQTREFLAFRVRPKQKNLFSRNEPNFNREASTLTHEITKDYNKLPCNGRRKNEPKANPIRTQNEPNTKPIRSQFEPKQTQFQPPPKRPREDSNL